MMHVDTTVHRSAESAPLLPNWNRLAECPPMRPGLHVLWNGVGNPERPGVSHLLLVDISNYFRWVVPDRLPFEVASFEAPTICGKPALYWRPVC